MQMKAQLVEETRPLVDLLLQRWLKFREFLQFAMSDKTISRNHDHLFLEVKSGISKAFSQVRNRLPRGLMGDTERMQDVMKQALSVTHVRNLPSPDKDQLYRFWHGYYIDLCRMSGTLKFMDDEKFYPRFDETEKRASVNIKADFVADAKKSKKKKR